ncbi:hypothetical protein ACIA2T_19785 [Amycolatopsis japonica]|uniref:hypothetical protein n=1 Tax=Amycolatopsis japonica TaxID=208439 RepID=UPI0037951B4A
METRETSAVMEALQKETKMFFRAGEGFTMESQEAYREQGVRWLKDHSELSTREIEGADWEAIYNYFND